GRSPALRPWPQFVVSNRISRASRSTTSEGWSRSNSVSIMVSSHSHKRYARVMSIVGVGIWPGEQSYAVVREVHLRSTRILRDLGLGALVITHDLRPARNIA